VSKASEKLVKKFNARGGSNLDFRLFLTDSWWTFDDFFVASWKLCCWSRSGFSFYSTV